MSDVVVGMRISFKMIELWILLLEDFLWLNL